MLGQKGEYSNFSNFIPSIEEESKLKEIRCLKCHVKLKHNQGFKVNWNPTGWLCYSCQNKWTELFFKKKLEKAMYGKREELINKVWRNFIDFNPSYR
jgi:hypothetical protein